MEFRWRTGFRAPPGLSAADARQAINRLADKLGYDPAPEDVVEAASHPRHALHKALEWDDALAGHEYRLAQARQIVASIIAVRVIGDKTIEVREFHSVTREEKEGRGYVQFDTIIGSRNYTSAVISQTLKAIASLERKLEAIDAAKAHELRPHLDRIRGFVERRDPEAPSPPPN